MNSPLEMQLVIGLPGSGKSTYIQRRFGSGGYGKVWTGYELICFDELRRALGHAYHVTTEQHVNYVACTLARVAFMRGRDVVVDESITVPGLAMDLAGVAREYGARVRIVHICAPVEECRANRVPHVMPAADFERKLAEWQTWGKFILSLGDDVCHLETVVDTPDELVEIVIPVSRRTHRHL